jgi:hypothetical protein
LASFDAHIDQAKKNLNFLVETNSRNTTNWDWQVTICFYAAVHIVNAHLAATANLHYRTHEDVKNAINPHAPLSLAKIPEPIYLAYVKLEGLSRRARYLCSDDNANRATTEFFTYDKHFAKAIKNLDVVLDHFKTLYNFTFPPLPVYCVDLSTKTPLKVFKYRALTVPIIAAAK